MTLQQLFTDAKALMTKYGKSNNTLFVEAKMKSYHHTPTKFPECEITISAFMDEKANKIEHATSSDAEIALGILELRLKESELKCRANVDALIEI